jgi:hypothetical protein
MARNVLKKQKIKPAPWLCFSYAIQEQDEGLRAGVRSSCDNMALVMALFLTITLPTYLSPPSFFAINDGQRSQQNMSEDKLVRLWFYIGMLTILAQGLCVMQSMIFRIFCLDPCVSDLQFLGVHATGGPSGGSMSGLMIVIYFMAGIFGTAIWFGISGFLIYKPFDAWMTVACICLGAFAVAYAWFKSLSVQMKLTQSTVQDFVTKNCDSNGDVTKKKRAE